MDRSDNTSRDAGIKGIQAIRQLSAALGIAAGLSELGVREEDLEIMANECNEGRLPAH